MYFESLSTSTSAGASSLDDNDDSRKLRMDDSITKDRVQVLLKGKWFRLYLKSSDERLLLGPFHPLEYSMSCLHRMGSNKKIRIEQESVNSVLLDDSPYEVNDQWFVAAQVGSNPTGSMLMARSTTFMPNQPGLGALLAMIFAPS